MAPCGWPVSASFPGALRRTSTGALALGGPEHLRFLADHLFGTKRGPHGAADLGTQDARTQVG